MTIHRVWISLGVSAACLVSVAGTSQAQRAAGVARAPVVSAAHARPVQAHAATAVKPNGKNAAAITHNHAGISSNGLGSFGTFGQFPAAGLNGPYGNWGTEAAIDPATQWRLFEEQRFHHNRGFAGAGFYILDGGAYYDASAAPPSGDADQGAPQDQGSAADNESANAPNAYDSPAEGGGASVAEEAAAPAEDVGQFVLVLRSGRMIQAVAFTRADDRIVYVTADGFRRALALGDLDMETTLRINEERGTPLQIPL